MNPALRRVAAVALVLALAAAAAFAAVDFAAAEHRTATAHRGYQASTGDAAVAFPDRVHLYVAGEGAAAAAVGDAVAAALTERGVAVERIGSAAALRADYGAPVLLVGVSEYRLGYNPVAPAATVRLHYEYAPAGNVTQFGRPDGDPGAAFDAAHVRERLLTGDTPSLRLDAANPLFRGGDLTVADSAQGVVSWPAYRRHVLGLTADRALGTLFGDLWPAG